MTGGSVVLDGVDVRDVTLRSLRQAIGVVSQDPFLFSATVRENIAFGVVDATDEQVEEAAQVAQAAEFIDRLPNGYDTMVGERGITLSGGQRQRIAIARALIVDPRVLIFDDATAAVDATTESKIKAGLREAMRGRTTIIIAHRLSTISLADEIVVLDDGMIAAQGTHDELLATSAVYREIYEHGLLEAGVRRRASRRRRESPPAGRHAHARARRRQDRRLVVARDRAAHRRRSAGLTAPYKARTGLAILFLVLATAVALLPPYLTKLAIDQGILAAGPAPASRRSSRCSSSPGIGVIATSAAQTYFTGWTGERILADLRSKLFRHLQRLSLGYFERNRAGVIISRLTNDVEALDQLVTDGVTSLVQNSLTLIGTAVILFFLDWRLALATMTILPLARHRDGALPQALVARVPAGARAARPRHRGTRRGHRRDARRPGVHAREAERARSSARSTSGTAPRTSARSC